MCGGTWLDLASSASISASSRFAELRPDAVEPKVSINKLAQMREVYPFRPLEMGLAARDPSPTCASSSPTRELFPEVGASRNPCRYPCFASPCQRPRVGFSATVVLSLARQQSQTVNPDITEGLTEPNNLPPIPATPVSIERRMSRASSHLSCRDSCWVGVSPSRLYIFSVGTTNTWPVVE